MEESSRGGREIPWQQRLFDSIWLLAAAAIVYFFLSYVVWGVIDVLRTRPGG